MKRLEPEWPKTKIHMIDDYLISYDELIDKILDDPTIDERFNIYARHARLVDFNKWELIDFRLKSERVVLRECAAAFCGDVQSITDSGYNVNLLFEIDPLVIGKETIMIEEFIFDKVAGAIMDPKDLKFAGDVDLHKPEYAYLMEDSRFIQWINEINYIFQGWYSRVRDQLHEIKKPIKIGSFEFKTFCKEYDVFFEFDEDDQFTGKFSGRIDMLDECKPHRVWKDWDECTQVQQDEIARINRASPAFADVVHNSTLCNLNYKVASNYNNKFRSDYFKIMHVDVVDDKLVADIIVEIPPFVYGDIILTIVGFEYAPLFDMRMFKFDPAIDMNDSTIVLAMQSDAYTKWYVALVEEYQWLSNALDTAKTMYDMMSRTYKEAGRIAGHVEQYEFGPDQKYTGRFVPLKYTQVAARVSVLFGAAE